MKKKHLLLIGLALLSFACNQGGEKDKSTAGKEAIVSTALTEKNACLLSEISYCKDISLALGKYLPGWISVWEASELEGNFAFVVTNGREYALVIRGSLIDFSWSAFQNWIYQDLHVGKQDRWEFTIDSSHAKIARGAFNGWQNLSKMTDKKTGQLLLPFLENELKDDSHLLITGHSLGGNLATVYASYLWQQFSKIRRSITNINVITFAAPAAGNEAFAIDFNKKFPSSIRVENANDIVPKFPNPSGISSLGNLYCDSLHAKKIMVGYKDLTISLSTVFTLLSASMNLLEFTNGISTYEQTNGNGKIVRIPLSGQHNGTDIMNWLGEAGYQHGIANYAAFEGVTVVECGK